MIKMPQALADSTGKMGCRYWPKELPKRLREIPARKIKDRVMLPSQPPLNRAVQA